MSDRNTAEIDSSRSPLTGAGLGLRADHVEVIHQNKPDIPWFEVLIDNYLNKPHIITRHLEQLRQDYPLTFHGVGLSIGSAEPLDMGYLTHLRNAIDRYAPVHVSDHLCWTGINGEYSHDLLPLPYTDEAVMHVAARIKQVQDFLGQRILIENVSTYLTFPDVHLTEAQFVSAVALEAECDLLLDVNNVYVSASNHDFDAVEYIRQLPAERVREYHLAGYEDQGNYLLDTHSQAVHEPVWQLFERTLGLIGPRPTLIEWDNHIPEFEVLDDEACKAQRYLDRYHANAA